MKRIYSRFFALALAMCMSATSWAIDIVDGVYQIGSADDMLEFANALLEKNGQVDAVMTADIDMSETPGFMLATSDVPLLGTFDGQFHTLNVQQEVKGEYAAPFRRLGGSAVVKNLIVTGTVVTAGKHCSSLVGNVQGTDVVVENCVSKVNIISNENGDGSHGGLLGGVDVGCAVTMNNCAFAGSIKSPERVTSQCGGICGWSDGSLVLNNVLLIAEFELAPNDNEQWGCLTFVRNPANSKLNNCYYLNPLTVVDADAQQITAEQLASGEACFLLNGSKSTDCTWFQNLSGTVDAMPVPDASHATVYLNGHLHCDGTPYEGGVFSNANEGNVQDEHSYDEGICTYCHQADKNFLTPGEDGYYSLATKGELLWFAAMVNSGEVGISARLTAPIDLEGANMPSIGNKNKKFSGSFDGQLQPITGITRPFFGQADNAFITGVALESGDIEGSDSEVCGQTGTLLGRGDNTTLTNSYSNVSIVLGNEGDCGGLVGKMNGSIEHCYFAGKCVSAAWSHAGIAGSNEGSLIINDCFVAADLYSNGGEAKGTIIGWEGGSTTITNCVSIACAGFAIGGGHKEGKETNCIEMSADEFAMGAATWFLNGESFASPSWFQNLGEGDEHPMLDASRLIVFKVSDEEYTNDMKAFKEALLLEGRNYTQELVAYKGDITAYTDALSVFEGAEDRAALAAAYTDVVATRKALDASAVAYEKYQNRLEEITAEVEKAEGLEGPAAEALTNYLEQKIGPCEQFPNGSSLYIVENMQLDVEGIEAEIAFANQLLDNALKANYKKGDEITALIVNPQFTAETRWDGWETKKDGSTLTTGNALGEEGGAELSVTTAGEFWNATGEVKQTLTGLKDGVYEVRVNAATRPASNSFNANDNHIAYLFANEAETYVQALTEDMVSAAEAIDGVNCHLTGNAPDQQLEIDGVTYYVPYGPVSAAFAFSGGRYENRVLAKVTDGNLTIGVRLDGTNLSNDWMGFGNFRLFYLGTEEEAADVMGEGLDSYIARANTLINYEASADRPDASNADAISYVSKPNFYNVLRTELQANIAAAKAATTTEDKLAACAKFTELFHQIYDSKLAYANYMQFADNIFDISNDDVTTTDDESSELANAMDEINNGYVEGLFTQEQAEAMALIKNTAYYQRQFANGPAFKDGFYQIASASDLVWFANMVNTWRRNTANAEIVAPIDLSEVAWQPIGTATLFYAGTFKGNLYPITGLSQMLFGTVDGVTIDGVNIQGGAVKGDGAYAGQTGTLAGCVESGTFTRCFSSATVSAGAVGDCGGLFGKVKRNFTMKNCMFAGNIMSGWSAGGLIGSTHYNYNDVPITISDVLVDTRNITYKNGDGHGVLVGWMHGNTHNALSNVWVIAGSDLTDLNKGDGDKAYVIAHTTVVTAEEAATGMVAWGLNRGEETNPVWFQTIGVDEVPTFSPESKIVYLIDGKYVNSTDPTAVEEVKEELNDEPKLVNVYDMNGRLLLRGVDSKTGLRSLPNGFYIIGGRKILK